MSTPVTATIAPAAPSTTAPSAPANPKGQLGKTDFLKLLVAQMKNQDPMDPLKGQDLAAQMAQFTSVEQLININQALTAQSGESSAIAAAINVSTATGAIGREITASGHSVAVKNGDDASVTIDVAGDGGKAVVHVFDAAGHEVGTRSDFEVKGGRQVVELKSATAGLSSGLYTYRVDVSDAEGKPVAVTPYIVAVIDSIRYTKDGPVLGAGALSIPFGTVIEIASKK